MAVDLPADAEPTLWVPWLLGLSIGPLFFAVSAQAPLIQRWFALAQAGRNPYALYAASNLGSFAGLIGYPLLVEPAMTLHGQSLLWSAGYGVWPCWCWPVPRGCRARPRARRWLRPRRHRGGAGSRYGWRWRRCRRGW